MAFSVYAAGMSKIDTRNKEFGIDGVHVPGMKSGDLILLTPHTQSNGVSGPEGRGPLYCAFINQKDDNGFEILVYDIQANKFNVTVDVDWAVVRQT